MKSPLQILLTVLLRGYQLGNQPHAGTELPFYRPVSNYAIEAIRVHGAGRASLLAGKRPVQMHPWHPGGVDPVPPH